MLVLWDCGISWFLLLSRCSLLQFGSLDLVVYLMMRTQSARVYPSTSHLVVRTDPPPICPFNFHHLSLSVYAHPPPPPFFVRLHS